MKISIVDYGMGNLRSVYKAMERIGYSTVITSKAEELYDADKIILPGVGHFKKGIDNLQALNLIEPLNKVAFVYKKPILGICLGMQIMAKYSEEGNVDGLGWIDGKVRRFKIRDDQRYKIPHMGWNTIKFSDNKIFTDITDTDEFYFVHSYHYNEIDKNQILATCTYEYEFIAAVNKDNIVGFQFHPEKSHDVGMKLLSNFLMQ